MTGVIIERILNNQVKKRTIFIQISVMPKAIFKMKKTFVFYFIISDFMFKRDH